MGNQNTSLPVKVPGVQREDKLNNFCIQVSDNSAKRTYDLGREDLGSNTIYNHALAR